MISAPDRDKAIELIDEAVEHGARLFMACKELNIHKRTYQRWKKNREDNGTTADLRPTAERPDQQIGSHLMSVRLFSTL